MSAGETGPGELWALGPEEQGAALRGRNQRLSFGAVTEQQATLGCARENREHQATETVTRGRRPAGAPSSTKHAAVEEQLSPRCSSRGTPQHGSRHRCASANLTVPRHRFSVTAWQCQSCCPGALCWALQLLLTLYHKHCDAWMREDSRECPPTHLWTGTRQGCTGSSAGQRPPSYGRSSVLPQGAGSSTGTACVERTGSENCPGDRRAVDVRPNSASPSPHPHHRQHHQM